MKRIGTVVGCLLFCISSYAQDAGAAFAAATIRANPTARFGKLEFKPGGRLTAIGVSVYQLVNAAYGLTGSGRIGKGQHCPTWIDSEKFDVEAVAEEGTIPEQVDTVQLRQRMQPLLQRLLAERFQLVIRHVPKEMPVYVLSVANSGATLTPAAKTEAECRVSTDCRRFSGSRMQGLRGESVTMADLVFELESSSDRPIVDTTAIQGLYTIEVKPYANLKTHLDDFLESIPLERRPPQESANPSLASVLEKNLGLLLRRSRAQIETIQIESVSRPSAN